ncbi:hypothetical protein [Magnetospirillum aberrantis]|uniref:Uncharacterized protein n=1 Tax=Magnetospirillum aberrantis SpK TaxID=908842 RepID=A0A7C9UWC5_9PROT|nr:hypothetical protein [Magnetospirillum aberrantis]NFV80032.1 hypothetical protein [Magnetospirillum aberrantis SpK]
MANDNIDGHLLAEMILDQLEAAIKGQAKAEADAAEQRSKVWSLEHEVKRLTEQYRDETAARGMAERELEALKAQIAGLTDTTCVF